MRETVCRHRAICLAAALSLPPILPGLAADELTVALDPAKTTIGFTLGAVLHSVHGSFQLREGHLSFDPATGAISGEVIVNATSGNSGNASRDERMTRDVLEARRYPEIRFNPTRFTGSVSAARTSIVQVTGSFLILGQSHEITIPMQIQMSQEEITAMGKFILPYVQWGMKNPSALLLRVNKTVEIELTAVGRVNSPHTP